MLDLEIAVRKHDGVVPIPFLGKSWRTRGPSHLLRRVWASFLILFAMACILALCGTGAYGISTLHVPLALHVTIYALYAATAIPGFIVVWESLKKQGYNRMRVSGAAGTGATSGAVLAPLSIMIAPYALGATVAAFAASLRKDFPGETQARALCEEWERTHPALRERRDHPPVDRPDEAPRSGDGHRTRKRRRRKNKLRKRNHN